MKHIIFTLLFTLTLFHCQSQDLLPFRVDTLWGYKDQQGMVQIEPQFQYATKFIGNVGIVAKNEKFGVIDKKNNQIIPFHCEFLRVLDTTEFLFGYRAKYFGEYIMGVMTQDEKIKIPAEYSYIAKYRNAYTVTKNYDNIIGQSNVGEVRSVVSKYGMFSSDGKLLIPCKFSSISWLNDTLLMVDSALLSAEGKFLMPNNALFNVNGKQLTEFKYRVFGKFAEGVAKARIDNKFGFIFPNGKVAIPIEFDFCEDFSSGYALIKQKNKWGAIDKNGKIVIQPAFDYKEVKAALEEKYSR
ncbi:MAG TPA: WG repeat-containing protein [Sediminibacterium sp.]